MRYGLFISLIWSSSLFAAVFPLPPNGSDLVGQLHETTVQSRENFPTIAQRYNVTFTGLVEANPGINPMRPRKGTPLIIPSAYLLPATPHKGIVINLAELRLYYYPPNSHEVYTYPVGIGVEGWNITPGEFKIIQKKKDPIWIATPSTREELLHKGFNIPESIPPGPDNPLGPYMLRLSNWTYLIHGCVDPATVGRRSSSGCFRMYNDNVQQLFDMVVLKTPVRVIDDPYKLGWVNGKLYLEAHLPLQEAQTNDDYSSLVNAINTAVGSRSADINWNRAFQLAREHRGIPEEIGTMG